MEHFQVLPTDDRYKALTDDQMDMLFAYYMISPEDVDLKRSYLQEVRTQQAVSSVPVNELRKMGYTDEQIQGIINDYRKVIK